MKTAIIRIAIATPLLIATVLFPAHKPTSVNITPASAHTSSSAPQTQAVTAPAIQGATSTPGTQNTPTAALAKPTIPVASVSSTVHDTSAPTTPVTSSDKCYTNCTDPNRPSFDGWGNEWDYMGNLINAACPNVNDPISGQPNPECVCPAPTSEGVYYIQGYGKETDAVVCGFSYYHACPYADAQPADGPVCAKLTAEAQAQQ